jgi:phage gpG-like protein
MSDTVKVEGLDEVVEFLQNLNKKLNESKALYAEAANVVVNAVEYSFETDRDYSGTPWAPLKPETIKRKGSSKKLYDKGSMQDSLYTTVTPVSAEVGISATSNGYPYPAVQQHGNKAGTVQARKFFPIDSNGVVFDGVQHEIMKAISDGLDSLIGSA